VNVEMKASAGSTCESRPASMTVIEPPDFGLWPEAAPVPVPVPVVPEPVLVPPLLVADDPQAVRTAAARAQPAMSVRRRRP
jgi:hypothetical protein